MENLLTIEDLGWGSTMFGYCKNEHPICKCGTQLDKKSDNWFECPSCPNCYCLCENLYTQNNKTYDGTLYLSRYFTDVRCIAQELQKQKENAEK